MARSRNRAQAQTSTTPFTCPECGRVFGRAAALGAHRRRAHGVVSQRATSRRSATNGARRAALPRPQDGAVDRNALLQAIFPNGVPARQDALASAAAWLDEAERLARLR